MVNGQVLEQVKKFKYLGQWITDDARCECEIKNRIEIARSTFIKMRDVLWIFRRMFRISQLDRKTNVEVLQNG